MICLFCQIVNKEKKAYIIAENTGAIAILDAFPVSEGHVLIVSKNHAENITQLKPEDWNNLFIIKKKEFTFFQAIVNKLQETFNPQGFNFITNMGEEAYQSIFHFHLHIIPKYQKSQGFIWTVANQGGKNNLEQVAEKLKKSKL